MRTTRTNVRHSAAHAVLTETRKGTGFRSHKLFGELGVSLDPFVSIEHFHMDDITFAPHPHAGFSAVTYLLSRSPGAILVRESSGCERRLGPGGVYWMEAGRGMMHEEVPEYPGRDCHGVQILVNLPAAHKGMTPRSFHLAASDLPVVTLGPGAQARVVCGARAGYEPRTRVNVLDVWLAPDAPMELGVPAEQAAFLLALEGSGEVGPEEAPLLLVANEACAFADDGGVVAARAGARGFHFLLVSGRPIGEDVVIDGPFVMCRREEIADAWARYAAGEMGQLTASKRPITGSIAT